MKTLLSDLILSLIHISLGIEDEYEGIGHCALGYVDGDYPDVIPRKENRVFYIRSVSYTHLILADR